MPNSSAARLIFPQLVFNACSMALRSSFSRFSSCMFSLSFPAVVCGKKKSLGRNRLFSLRMTARSSVCCSSRTLPGQLYFNNLFLASRVSPLASLWYFRLYLVRKCSASSRMSSPLSRSGGDAQLDGVDAVKQVLPETAFCYPFVQVGIGGANQPYIYLNGFDGTQPCDAFLFDGGQQPCLHGE